MKQEKLFDLALVDIVKKLNAPNLKIFKQKIKTHEPLESHFTRGYQKAQDYLKYYITPPCIPVNQIATRHATIFFNDLENKFAMLTIVCTVREAETYEDMVQIARLIDLHFYLKEIYG